MLALASTAGGSSTYPASVLASPRSPPSDVIVRSTATRHWRRSSGECDAEIARQRSSGFRAWTFPRSHFSREGSLSPLPHTLPNTQGGVVLLGICLPQAQLSDRRFELVSAEAQPVSGRSCTKISDIEKSTRRDLPPDLRPLVRAARIFSQETGLLAPNLRKCRNIRRGDVGIKVWTAMMIELPGVRKGGMPGRNAQ
jgi:hypothetical protein